MMESVRFSHQEVTIAEIQPEHLPPLTAFLVANDVPEMTRYFHPFPFTEETARSIASAPHRDIFIGAFHSDRMIGLSMLRGWDEGYEIPSFGILVDRRYQRNGIGSRMLEITIQKAVERSCTAIRLSVYLSNTHALRWYSSNGFVEVSRIPVEVHGETDFKIVAYKSL